MTAIDLYKFYKNHSLEYHWNHNNLSESGYDNDVILFVDIWCVEEFMKLLKSSKMTDTGFVCRMKDRYFCFWMAEICEYFDIDLTNVFEIE